jgi:hypothetical protein
LVSFFKGDGNIACRELAVSVLGILLIVVRVSDPVAEASVENARGFSE